MTGPTDGPRTEALLQRVRTLEGALDRAGDRVPAATHDVVLSTLAGVRERLALGVDHTVAALVGGTGSGKSSVFNALTGLEFADVGVRRPTTSQVTACVWAHDATELLDWLGVSRDRRIERESELDGESQADLRGLVLLDLPDHDSVEPEHRAVVDRLVPLVDLLIWVVDPQKYADDALHTGYLRHLVGHEGAMLVVLNQIDTVPVPAQAGLLRDVARLLAEDGLTGVGVHSASARRGDGIPVVRGALARAVEGRGIAELRASAEIDDAAAALAAAVGPDETADLAPHRRTAVDGLATAAGVGGTVAAVDRAVSTGRSVGAATLGPAQLDRVRGVRERWVTEVSAGLPEAWQRSLAGAVPAAETLADAVEARLASVPVIARRSRAAAVVGVVAGVLGVVGLVALGLAAGTAVAHGWTADVTMLAGVTAGAALGGLVLLRGGSAARSSAGRHQTRELTARAGAALGEVVDEVLLAPTRAVLDDHRAVRAAAQTNVSPTPPEDGVSTG